MRGIDWEHRSKNESRHLEHPQWEGLKNGAEHKEMPKIRQGPGQPDDCRGHVGMLYMRACPSCKNAWSEPYFVDVQCHWIAVNDTISSAMYAPEYVRFGDWSTVVCDTCCSRSKFGDWVNESFFVRPRETVFKHGSTCFSYRNSSGGSTRFMDVLWIFKAEGRKKDGVLIWKKREEETRQARLKSREVGHRRVELVEKVLDIRCVQGGKHNQIVRTRNEAAKETLASI